MKFEGLIACICEGAAEKAIIELLLDNSRLSFEKKELLDEQIITIRSAEKFEEKYLRKHFSDKITILRILDSRRENFKLSKPYRNKVDVINIITAPEIEMLIIHHENKYADFKKSGEKPSDYCKIDLKYKDVKNYNFVKKYFADIDDLLNAITQYRRKASIKKGEKTLYDLLK